MKRFDIINKLIEKNGFESYLEIGLNNPDSNFNKINCNVKHSVDPFFEVNGDNVNDENYKYALSFLTFRMTSDEFFKNSTMKYDIIFVDGLHTERQAGKDIINGLKHLNDGGYLIVHDCLPASYEAQVVPRMQSLWNGDVWKCIPELNKQFVDYEVVDCDHGCCIVKFTPDYDYLNWLEKSKYTYDDFEKYRNGLMHVISEEEFLEKYINN